MLTRPEGVWRARMQQFGPLHKQNGERSSIISADGPDTYVPQTRNRPVVFPFVDGL